MNNYSNVYDKEYYRLQVRNTFSSIWKLKYLLVRKRARSENQGNHLWREGIRQLRVQLRRLTDNQDRWIVNF